MGSGLLLTLVVVVLAIAALANYPFCNKRK